MLHRSKCLKMLDHIVKTVSPKQVMLFGSAVGSKKANDLDFLIVVADSKNTRALAHNLYQHAPRLGIGVDFIVATKSEYLNSKDAFWSVTHEALRKGTVFYDSKAV